jgi:hypothetical protein
MHHETTVVRKTSNAFWTWKRQQARYEASLAERRYAACDPDNRLIAAQLEKSWEAALQRVRDFGDASAR